MQISEISTKEMLYFLSRIRGLGYSTIKRLFEYISPLHRILWMSEEELKEETGLTVDKISAIHAGISCFSEIMEEYQQLIGRDMQFLTFEEESFPKRLLEIEDHPYYIYVKGKIPDHERKAVAIVGSRTASTYGNSMAELFAKELAKEGVDIISGLAFGIDAAAHRGVLGAGYGYTYGILGTGLNICYPKENFSLYQKMAKGDRGGLITEFSPGTEALRFNFPQRNRIIAGLSDAVIIIEAKERSGSLITAEYALEQGKQIYALPGRVTDIFSKGCNRLIADGASILTGVDDILEGLSMAKQGKLLPNEKKVESLTKYQKKVMDCLDADAKFIDQIIEETNLKFGEVYTALMELELSGYIRCISNNYYARLR